MDRQAHSVVFLHEYNNTRLYKYNVTEMLKLESSLFGNINPWERRDRECGIGSFILFAGADQDLQRFLSPLEKPGFRYGSSGSADDALEFWPSHVLTFWVDTRVDGKGGRVETLIEVGEDQNNEMMLIALGNGEQILPRVAPDASGYVIVEANFIGKSVLAVR